MNRSIRLAAALALCLPLLAGCRTGIRRVTSAIEGQGVSAIDWSQKPEEKKFSYLTSENTAFDAQGVNITYDPASGGVKVKLDSISMVRTPSDNQDTFAKQLYQGRTADTEAIQSSGDMLSAAFAGLGAGIASGARGVVPIVQAREEQHTARTGIRAERDVDLQRIHAEAAAAHGGEGAPPE